MKPGAPAVKQRLSTLARAGWRATSGVLLLGFGLHAPAWAATPPTPFALHWALERNVHVPEGDYAQAVFTLKLQPGQALPGSGWALYFSCIAEAIAEPLAGNLVLEQVAGTLYRLRPAPGFAGVPAGQTLQVRYRQPGTMRRPDKGPQGPYLVFDDAPGVGRNIVDFTAEPLVLAQQDGAPPTPGELFEQHRRALDPPLAQLPPVFPSPKRVERREGQLRWTVRPMVQAPPSLGFERQQLSQWLAPYFSPALSSAASSSAATTPSLRLRIGAVPGEASPEAYELNVDPKRGVSLTGRSAAGVARGLQSLRDLLPAPDASGLELPALRIVDAPRFAYRGLLVDVARNFQSKATLMRLVDLMARHKLNTLHLHLSDDEGWRLEIPGLPELTEVGGRRGHDADEWRHLPPAHGSGADVADPHGSGFYSRADYIELLHYAAARHITVLPEIEMPGHARAAVRAMAARERRLLAAGRADAQQYRLRDPADPSVYRSAQLYTDNVMDPGLPSTYAFIEHVVGAVVAMHRAAGVPLKTLHVGADELPGAAWTRSPASLALMAREDLADRDALWKRFYLRVDAVLKRHRVRAAGWEELGAHRVGTGKAARMEPNPALLGRGFSLFVWNNLDESDDLAYRLANAGYDVVLAPATRLYFDMAPTADPADHGVDWASLTDLDAVFGYVPLDDLRRVPADPTPLRGKTRLTAQGRAHVLGLEGTLFSETMRDPARIEELLMPRLFALAERAWAADPGWARESDPARAATEYARAWSIFVHQLGRQVLPRLDREMPGLNYRIPPPGLSRTGEGVRVSAPWPGLIARYTTDGREPDMTSPVALGAIVTDTAVRVALFNTAGRRGRSSALGAR